MQREAVGGRDVSDLSGTDVSHIKATDVTDLTALCRKMLVRILPLSTDILAIRQGFVSPHFVTAKVNLNTSQAFFSKMLLLK